jgi:thiol-disulfide isomerase/thioredoxin
MSATYPFYRKISKQRSVFEDPEKAGALQEFNILSLAKTPKPPEHVLKLFFSKQCPHCKVVIPQIENYVKQYRELLLMKIDATTQEGTNQLEVVLKGLREVPAVIVDDCFVVKGETNMLPRLILAIHLAGNLSNVEEEERCLFRQ